MNAPFIGRREELDRLAELQLRALRARLPAASLITGEPGTGKSRLLAQVLDRSKLRQSRLVGFEPLRSVPLAAAAALLRLLATFPGPARDLDRLVFGGAAQESRDPLRIFEGAHRALALSGPTMIAIDDLQWVDELSLGLVGGLSRSTQQSWRAPLMVSSSRASVEADR